MQCNSSNLIQQNYHDHNLRKSWIRVKFDFGLNTRQLVLVGTMKS
jgi:hypothetical protein